MRLGRLTPPCSCNDFEGWEPRRAVAKWDAEGPAVDGVTAMTALAAWNDLGLDRLICAAPGVADTDDSLDELVVHLESAGVTLSG